MCTLCYGYKHACVIIQTTTTTTTTTKQQIITNNRFIFFINVGNRGYKIILQSQN